MATAVCVSVCLCLCLAAFPHYCTDVDVTRGNGRKCPLVVHSWADLQSVHGFVAVTAHIHTHVTKLIALYTANAYSAKREMSASAFAHSVAGFKDVDSIQWPFLIS